MIQEHFQKYYDAVMPYLKVILMKATDKSNRMLRAKSMECISLVGMAVGKEKFRADAKQVFFLTDYILFVCFVFLFLTVHEELSTCHYKAMCLTLGLVLHAFGGFQSMCVWWGFMKLL